MTILFWFAQIVPPHPMNSVLLLSVLLLSQILVPYINFQEARNNSLNTLEFLQLRLLSIFHVWLGIETSHSSHELFCYMCFHIVKSLRILPPYITGGSQDMFLDLQLGSNWVKFDLSHNPQFKNSLHELFDKQI